MMGMSLDIFFPRTHRNARHSSGTMQSQNHHVAHLFVSTFKSLSRLGEMNEQETGSVTKTMLRPRRIPEQTGCLRFVVEIG